MREIKCYLLKVKKKKAMVRGHPAGGTIRIISNGVPYACRSKPLKRASSYRDPALYSQKEDATSMYFRQIKMAMGLRRGGSKPTKIFWDFKKREPKATFHEMLDANYWLPSVQASIARMNRRNRKKRGGRI